MTSSGDILLASSDAGKNSYLARYSQSGVLLNTYEVYGSSFGMNAYALAQGGDGRTYAIDSYGGYIQQYATTTGLSTAYSGPIASLKGTYGELATSGGLGMYLDAVTQNLFSLTLNGSMSVNSTTSFAGDFSTGSGGGVAFGHGKQMFLAGKNASGGKIMRYNYSTGTKSILVNSSAYGEFTNLATVVAPEPTSMMAIASAIGMLALRRRKR
jgi:hypothetical protein